MQAPAPAPIFERDHYEHGRCGRQGEADYREPRRRATASSASSASSAPSSSSAPVGRPSSTLCSLLLGAQWWQACLAEVV